VQACGVVGSELLIRQPGQEASGNEQFDAFLLVSFGGPESREEVLPFLENVTRGRHVPHERLLDVAEHYYEFDGKSPINQQCRDLLTEISGAFKERKIELPLYWGNRNWDPMLVDTLQQMADDGIKHALAFFTSAYSGYSSCRQYRENIGDAQKKVGSRAPCVTKLRQYYDHPGFIQPLVEQTRTALAVMRKKVGDDMRILFTAHSIPVSMAEVSMYQTQLEMAAQNVIESLGEPNEWDLVFQSRSGSPSVAWLEPDINQHLDQLKAKGIRGVVVVPIGFVSDHMEVIFDLDKEASGRAAELGLEFVRVSTVGTDPQFIEMVCELVEEQLSGEMPKHLCEPISGFVACAGNCCLGT
jgi:ferrochelatase